MSKTILKVVALVRHECQPQTMCAVNLDQPRDQWLTCYSDGSSCPNFQGLVSHDGIEFAECLGLTGDALDQHMISECGPYPFDQPD